MIDKLKYRRLTVYHGVLKDELISSLIKFTEENTAETKADFLRALFFKRAEENLKGYIAGLILSDENPFTLASAKGENISELLIENASDDLKTLEELADSVSAYSKIAAVEPLSITWKDSVKKLNGFHREFGCGKFINHSAFIYENGGLEPAVQPSDISVKDLKDYVYEKKIISENIERFLNGLPYSNMLLYGDRGTGKSSTIHAMLNRFKPKLKLVEIKKGDIGKLPSLLRTLELLPHKFLVFSDDLTFSDDDPDFSAFKGALEGSIESRLNGCMLAVTSNRRNILKESLSARESVHLSDVLDEQASLADRFGLAVLFLSPSKEEYLSIIKQILAEKGAKAPKDLETLAERFAISRGSRSPRTARLFADSCV